MSENQQPELAIKPLQAEPDARARASAKNAREAYGLPETASDQELTDARARASAAIRDNK